MDCGGEEGVGSVNSNGSGGLVASVNAFMLWRRKWIKCERNKYEKKKNIKNTYVYEKIEN